MTGIRSANAKCRFLGGPSGVDCSARETAGNLLTHSTWGTTYPSADLGSSFFSAPHLGLPATEPRVPAHKSAYTRVYACVQTQTHTCAGTQLCAQSGGTTEECVDFLSVV